MADVWESRSGIHADGERYQAFDFWLVGPISAPRKFFFFFACLFRAMLFHLLILTMGRITLATGSLRKSSSLRLSSYSMR